MIHFDGVRKSFKSNVALSGVDLSIPEGRTTVLLGTSGCGKSTLLRLVVGLIAADQGRVVFDGTEVTSDSVLAVRRRVGYVIQDGGLFPHLTARQNVCIMADHLKWAEERKTARVRELASLTQLDDDLLDKFPVQLSGGQRQRVGIMRALMLDPAVLLLDEPLGALDPITRAELQADLREIFRSLAKTVILVTHDLNEAFFFGDRIVLLRDGAIVQDGTIADLLHRPKDPFVSRFVNAQRQPELPEDERP